MLVTRQVLGESGVGRFFVQAPLASHHPQHLRSNAILLYHLRFGYVTARCVELSYKELPENMPFTLSLSPA